MASVRRWLAASSLVLVCLACVAQGSAKVQQEDDVYVLGDDNFDDFVKEHKFVLAEFYAPWCGHCKSLEPEYAAAAKEIHAKDDARLAKIDATIHTALAERFGVNGFPTLKFFRNGVDTDYTGGRTTHEIVSWVGKKSGPPAKPADSVEMIEQFAELEDVLIVGLFKDLESDGAKAFSAVADELEGVFLVASDDKIFEHFKKDADSVVILKHFDDKRVDLDDSKKLTEDSIREWVTSNSLPWVMEFNEANAQRIFGGDANMHVLLFGDLKGKKVLELMDCYSQTAREFLGKAMFVTVDTTVEDNGNVVQFFGIVPDSTDVELRAVNLDENMTKYKPDAKEISCDTFTSFAKDFLSGKLEAYRMSEEVPEDWDKEPVKVLVGKNFREVTQQKDKAIFVEFYAPWCGHCQALAPTWDELAKDYADNDKVMIAKIDGTANEIEGIAVQGFPTLKMFVDGEVLEYEGDRELAALKKYVDAVLRGERPAPEHSHSHDHGHDHEHEHEFEDDFGEMPPPGLIEDIESGVDDETLEAAQGKGKATERDEL